MSESPNPYAPPRAKVGDTPGTPIERPRPIVLAMRLLWGSMALSVVYLVLDWEQYFESDVPPLIMAAILVAAYAAYAFIYVQIADGANWARILVLALSGLTAVSTFPELPVTAQRAPLVAGIELICTFADLFALYLLFVPGREWFRPRR